LRTFVLVFPVYVFKADGAGAGQSLYLNALFPYILHNIHLRVGKGGDQQKAVRVEMLDGMRKVKGSAARHVYRVLGSNYLILCDITDAT
jgi:hypothetical protein